MPEEFVAAILPPFCNNRDSELTIYLEGEKMTATRVLTLLFCLAAAAPAQLTTDQRIADFRNLADLYANRYAMHQWKREALQVDALNVEPWLERVRTVKDDLGFYEVCVDYVASLYDAHDNYYVPSTFEARLGFTVDVYDGKVLIDSVDRYYLPAFAFPFTVGDELVSLDGRTPEEWIAAFERYSKAGNPRTMRRVAAEWITSRVQQVMPHAHEIGESAIVIVRRQNGDEEQYEVPWEKSGTPLISLSPGVSPRSAATARPKAAEDVVEGPEYMRPVRRLQNLKLPRPPAVLGEGALAPVFAMPDDFALRLGARSYDPFYSGTYTSGGRKIGFIRIPDFYRSISAFEKEIQYFQSNTDGLVIDITRNPGGNACNAEELLARVIPSFFQVVLEEVRVTWSSLLEVQYYLEQAREYGDPVEIEQMEAMAEAFESAYRENNGRTRPVTDLRGQRNARARKGPGRQPYRLHETFARAHRRDDRVLGRPVRRDDSGQHARAAVWHAHDGRRRQPRRPSMPESTRKAARA